MAKYSLEFKMKAVMDYTSSYYGYEIIAKNYGIHSSILKGWVNNYERSGIEGLRRSRRKKTYSYDFKLRVVKVYLTGEMSYQDLANQYDINNKSMIANWVINYRRHGPEGLMPKKKGRPAKMADQRQVHKSPDKTNKKEYSIEELDRMKELEEENYWLKMEVDFLKKKIELRERINQSQKK